MVLERVVLSSSNVSSVCFFFFQSEDGIRNAQESRGLGDVYKRQLQYIADQQPGTIAPVFCTNARWQLMEWLNFISTEVHKGFGPLWNPQTPADVRERTVQAPGNRFPFWLLYTSDAAVDLL